MADTNTPDIIDDKPENVKSDLRKFNKAEEQVNKAIAELEKITNIADAPQLETALDIIKRSKKVDAIIEAKRVSLVKPYNDEVKRINEYAKSLKEKLPPAIKKASDAVLDYNARLEKERINLRTASRIHQLGSLLFTPNSSADDYAYYQNGDILVTRVIIEQYDEAQWITRINEVLFSIEQRNKKEIESLTKQAEADAFFGESNSPAIEEKVKELSEKPVAAAPIHVPAFGGGSGVKGVTKRWTFTVLDASQVPREYLQVDEAKIREAMNKGIRHIPGVEFKQVESLTSR